MKKAERERRYAPNREQQWLEAVAKDAALRDELISLKAENAALRVERDAAFALLRVCQDSVHPDTRTVILALIGDTALLAGKEGK